MKRLLWSLTAAVLCSAGCSPREAPRQSWEDRLAAALAISHPTNRWTALKELASEAATAGRDDIVKPAVAAIEHSTTKDEAAAECALKLADAGKSKGANEVALMISHPTNRDEVLKKLAKGAGK